MCINCMLCYAACPIYGWIRISSGRPPSPSRSAITTMGATRAHESAWRSSRNTKASGAAPSSGMHEGLSEECRSGRRHSTLQARCVHRMAQVVLHAAGRAMSGRQAHAYHPRWIRTSVHLLVAATCVLFCVHPARAEQHLRRLVRRVSPAARSRGQSRSIQLRGVPGLVGPAGGSGVERREPVVHRVPRDHLVQPGAQGDGGARGKHARAGIADCRVQLPGLGVASALVGWLLLG